MDRLLLLEQGAHIKRVIHIELPYFPLDSWKSDSSHFWWVKNIQRTAFKNLFWYFCFCAFGGNKFWKSSL